ncbi:unnamed protein product [Cuscuta europaea]|uniref:Uncharacterized protein n=1 Tax=Cuscuta europaea TaxID=41803 RepID=A0A9P0YZK5_CUSEU|nr:unnamed protein product [Cuscuta europaea]
MDHHHGKLPSYYYIKRLGLEHESEDVLSQQLPDQALSTKSAHMINYLNKILLEEDDDENSDDLLLGDPAALRAAEDYFYEALGENLSLDSSVGSQVGTSSSDIDAYNSSSQTNLDGLNGSLYSFDRANLLPNIHFDDEATSIFQFHSGVGEAKRFFPSINPMVIHFGHKCPLELETEELNSGSALRVEKDHSADSCRGRKHYRASESGLEEEKEEERSRKQSAIYEEDLTEAFDKVFLCADDDDVDFPSAAGKQQQKGRNGRKSHSNKHRADGREIVDLQPDLISCAKLVADANYRAALEKLEKIRHYSSPTGDANQRLAHAFADGLEALLARTGLQLNASSSLCKTNNFPSYASELQKSRLSSSMPFMRIFIFFANKMIYDVASRATSLHVIDFGILHGIQWPTLIRDLSQRHGGPPKLRITGIELPQPGFRPSQTVVETGCRLARYCKRFGVPFEYNAITAKNWEALKIVDLKLKRGEVVAVNCNGRLTDLPDETSSGADIPRDSVLNLIREVNPHIFVYITLSASHNSPFFVNRFKSALFFYSSVFDMFEAIFPPHDGQRLHFEQAVMRPVIANIIACEGMERFERPETYKQWQCRTMRAGFKPLPPSPNIVEKLRAKAREAGHKDFLFAEDGHWVLLGWKGRVLACSSAWVTHNH